VDRPEALAGILIRQATLGDAPAISHLVRRMLAEMVGVGGHAVSTDEAAWARFAGAIALDIENDERLFLFG
jgi:hypothetical protein